MPAPAEFDPVPVEARERGRRFAPRDATPGGEESGRPGLTPAARTMNELRANDESFFDFALRLSKVHQSYFRELYPPNESRLQEFQHEAEESLVAQSRIEAADRLTFDQYLQHYFST